MTEAAAGTFRVGRHRYAAGLFWQPAATAVQAVREARLVASKPEIASDLFCVRRKGCLQFGLAQSGAGHRAGLPAVAALLANAVPQSDWLGVFAVEAGWFYISVRKKAIVADGDLLFGSEEQARERLAQDQAGGAWEKIFAPEHWALPVADGRDLATVLAGGSDARLRPVHGGHRSLHILLAMMLCGGVGLAASGVISWRPSAPVPDVPVAPPPPPPPWQGHADNRALILACERTMRPIRPFAGFELEALSCGPGGVSATLRRMGGQIGWLPKNVVVLSPDRARLSVPLVSVPGTRSDGELPLPADMVRRTIWGAAQSYALDSELSDAPAAPPLPGRSAESGPVYRSLSISLGTRLPVSILAEILAPLPAFVVEEVLWQPAGWRVKGKAYVR